MVHHSPRNDRRIAWLVSYLCRVSDWQANPQIIDRELQEERPEGLGRGLLDSRQHIYHLLCSHVNVLMQGHPLFVPVVVGSLVVQPKQHSC